MKSNILNQIFGRNGSRTKGNSGIDVEPGFLKAAEDHFARDLPNPAREGCPPPANISALILSRRMPGEGLREHLLSCSECFRYYQATLISARESTLRTTPPSDRVRRRLLIPAFAGLGALVLVLGVGMIIVRWTMRETIPATTTVTEGKRSPVAASSPLQSATSSESPEPPRPKSEGTKRSREANESSPPTLIAKTRVVVDLERLNVLRSPSRTPADFIILSANRTELMVRLPLKSPQGVYKVTLADPFGNSIRTTSAQSTDGATLRAQLDLVEIKPGRYLICVTREEEVPDCVSATVKAK